MGDLSPKVADIKAYLRREFPHASGLNYSELYDERLKAVVANIQILLGLPATGVMDYATQRACGYSKPAPPRKPTLFTVHGTGQPDPLGPGIPADTARAVLDLYDWQPIGNYPAAPFPMWPSILDGVEELSRQIDQRPGPFAMAGYSQGAVVVGQVLKHRIMDPAGSLHHRLKDLRKVVFWGNPMRQKGVQHSDEWTYPTASPDSHGILDDRLEGLESAAFEVRDYAHEGDMYACNYDTDADEYKRAVCKIVMKATDLFYGEDSLLAQLGELVRSPVPEGIAMGEAIVNALQFFGGGTAPHAYNFDPAVEFLRG